MFQGYFPVIYTYQTFAIFLVKRTKKLAAFWKLAPRLDMSIICKHVHKLELSFKIEVAVAT